MVSGLQSSRSGMQLPPGLPAQHWSKVSNTPEGFASTSSSQSKRLQKVPPLPSGNAYHGCVWQVQMMVVLGVGAGPGGVQTVGGPPQVHLSPGATTLTLLPDLPLPPTDPDLPDLPEEVKFVPVMFMLTEPDLPDLPDPPTEPDLPDFPEAAGQTQVPFTILP